MIGRIIRSAFTVVGAIALAVAGSALAAICRGVGEDREPIHNWPDSSDWED